MILIIIEGDILKLLLIKIIIKNLRRLFYNLIDNPLWPHIKLIVPLFEKIALYFPFKVKKRLFVNTISPPKPALPPQLNSVEEAKLPCGVV